MWTSEPWRINVFHEMGYKTLFIHTDQTSANEIAQERVMLSGAR